jgi:hypothetical protein
MRYVGLMALAPDMLYIAPLTAAVAMTTVTAPGSSIQLTETPMREESIDSTTGYSYLGVERREAPITFETEFLSDDDTDDDSDNASIGSGSGLSASYFEGE